MKIISRAIFIFFLALTFPANAFAGSFNNLKCWGSSLSDKKFLDILQAIIMHADLSDISFLEKTLQTKFEARHSGITDYSPDNYMHDRYTANTMLGAPVHLVISVNWKKDAQGNSGKNARMRFENDQFFTDCLAISSPLIQEKFGNAFKEYKYTGLYMPEGGVPNSHLAGHARFTSKAKDGYDLDARYILINNTITQPAIEQHWK